MMMFMSVCVQFLHKLTARAIIGDYEDGSLESNEAEHEVRSLVLASASKSTSDPLLFRSEGLSLTC